MIRVNVAYVGCVTIRLWTIHSVELKENRVETNIRILSGIKEAEEGAVSKRILVGTSTEILTVFVDIYRLLHAAKKSNRYRFAFTDDMSFEKVFDEYVALS